MSEVAVVICTYNKCEYVMNCIESVFKSNYKDFDLIVVDNASTDGTVEAIKKGYGDELTLLVNETNTGGSGGFHRGMVFAMEKKYKYVHLLDNDVVIDPDAIGNLYEFMGAHPGAGVCGSLVLYMDFPEKIQDYGAVINVGNLGVRPLYEGENAKGPLPEYVECDYVAACSAMYRCAALEEAGPIEEDYFIYWDDISLCWKLKLEGYPTYACAASRVWHKVGKLGRNSSFRIYYFTRNKIHSMVKYCSDEEYKTLPENIVKRMFRTFAVNTKSNNANYAYYHAFNDALNGIRGKADAYKLVPDTDPELVFGEKLTAAKTVLILPDDDFKAMEPLVASIKKYAQNCMVFVASQASDKEFDITIKLCSHVLDLPEYDRNLIYVDRYLNQLADDDDFDLVMDLENQYKFFCTVFYPFAKSKLDALRQQFGHTLPGE